MLVEGILRSNKGKNFVDRIINYDKSPTLDLGKGKVGTHLMAWGEVDGKFVVYPTIVQEKGGELKKLEQKEAHDYAMQNNEFIKFDTSEQADWFSKNYKAVWPEEMR